MTDIAIKVENLSKRYRIGVADEQHDTLVGATLGAIRNPARNFQRLRQLTRFRNGSEEDPNTIWALKNVSFEVKRGEVVGVIGRNGAGKSTLLKILSRITHPTSGRVELHGRVSSLLEVGTGFHPELTGRENVYLNGTILGMRKVEIDRKFDEIVDFSGVEKFIDTPVKRYSSGMRVRLAFSVAAHLEPEILLVDEVLAVGDSEFQRKCLGKMNDVAAGGRTVMFVSHNLVAVLDLCPRSVWLRDGSIAKQGHSKDVIEQYLGDSTVQGFISLTDHKNRRSSSVPIMSSVAFMKGDSVTTSFATGESWKIEVECRPTVDYVTQLSLGFAIHDGLGRTIFAANMDQYDKKALPTDTCRIRAVIDRLMLAPGRYGLSLFLSNGAYDIDVVDQASSFDVFWNNDYGLAYPPRPSWGATYMLVNWEEEDVSQVSN
ncbi:MAG: ABC transporter ATP-binding protein [Anaerolineae bacterium]|nr:ABC transporter ATP-binding protein [Anaerolineae bacterium]